MSRPAARSTDPATSHEAAAAVTPRAPAHRVVALLALAEAGSNGLTDYELEARTGIRQTSIGCRRKDLVRLGLVFERLTYEGEPVRRPGPTGALCQVWCCSWDGYEAARYERELLAVS